MKSKTRTYALIALALSLFLCDLSWADEADLIWSTFLGGSENEQGEGIALDGSGSAYVVGSVRSTEFPTTAGAFDTTYNTKTDAFVVKLNPTGSALDYATFLGGNGGDRSYGIAVDDSGHAYVVGFTYSANFPVTVEAFDTTHNSYPNYDDVFIAKLDPMGSALIYATFLGGRRNDGGYGIAVDDSGHAYVIGDTESSDFPATVGAFDTTYHNSRDIFVARLDRRGGALDYATFLGGSSNEYGETIAIDGAGHAYITGETLSEDFPTTAGAFDTTFNSGTDALVLKLNPLGSALDYATFLGGSSGDRGVGIAVDDSGCAYLTGYAMSSDFPTTAGVFDRTHNGSNDAFVAKLSAMGNILNYSTFLGGSSDDRGIGIAVDGSGNAYVTGRAASTDFPTTAGAFDTTHNGDEDVFLVKLDPMGSNLDYATFLGGSGYDWGQGIALDGFGNVCVVGITRSSNFPTTAGAFDTTYHGWEDVFVLELAPVATTVASEAPSAGLPRVYILHQNYPNPFNASTEIRYQIPEDGPVSLKVFNIMGQEVRTLVDDYHVAGDHVVTWDGTSGAGEEVASGVYFCTINAGDFRAVRKMVLLR